MIGVLLYDSSTNRSMNEERQGNGLDGGARSAAKRSGAAEANSLGEFLETGPSGSVPPAPDAIESQAQRLRFTADGWEYFRIWIVNVALTLLTLGIYSAWAKVRARRYLYGHIWLGDTAFDYTANPVAILRGRILVAIVATILWFANLFSLWYYYAALAVLMPLVPWVVVKARTFQLRNSRYRGIAFDFQGKYWDAAVWYPLAWVASFVTFGLAWPFRVFGRDRYLIRRVTLRHQAVPVQRRSGALLRRLRHGLACGHVPVLHDLYSRRKHPDHRAHRACRAFAGSGLPAAGVRARVFDPVLRGLHPHAPAQLPLEQHAARR